METERNAQAPPKVQYKECEDSRNFIVHKEHYWEKPRGWRLFCEGIPPVEEQPPCQAYISPEQPLCGKPAPAIIHVHTLQIDATVEVCKEHKKAYMNRAAARRQAAKAARESANGDGNRRKAS